MTTNYYILTKWNPPAGRRGWHPDIDQFTKDWEDVTGQADVSKAKLGAALFRCQLPHDDPAPVIAHPDYGEGAIVRVVTVDDDGKETEAKPDEAKLEKFRATLETKGATKDEIDLALGDKHNDRKGVEIAAQLVEWLKVEAQK